MNEQTRTPEAVNGLTSEQLREKLRKIKCFMLDMDGTFYLGDKLLPGSLDFLDALHRTGRTARFLTNNSSKSAKVYRDKLTRMNVPEEYRDVITSGHAAAHYCLKAFPGKSAWVLGNDMLKEELTAMGLRISEDNPDYVLIAYDTTLDYAKMTKVCDLVRAGLPYIATHPDFNCPTETGFAPDIGAIMAFIEASAGRRPDLILGKPYKGIVEEALNVTGLQKSDLAMVGDRLYTDVATGVNFGMTSILVMSGETTEAMLAASDIRPTAVFGRLSDMIPYL